MTPNAPLAASPPNVADAERIEAAMQFVLTRRDAGADLTVAEIACVETLEAMLEAEAEARASFSAFYATLVAPVQEAGPNEPASALPESVSAHVGHWIACRKRWEAAVRAYLETLPAGPPKLPRRAAGERPPARAFTSPLIRVPTAAPARDALLALFAPHLWTISDSGTAITAAPGAGDTQVRIECDDEIGFGPERAVQQIAKYGASAAQTFLTMAGFWLEQARGQSPETYVTAYASDLLRYQKRKETPRGGYHAADLLAKGRDVYLLSRISLPRAAQVRHENGARVTRTLSITRLLSLESLDAQQTRNVAPAADKALTPPPPRTLVKFRYHLGRDVYDWVHGDHPQYTHISRKLLGYHSVRQKYPILLGFCLAYYDRVNRKDNRAERRIRLPALLNLAAVPVPDKRVAEFFTSIEDALNDLARDNVIPGLRLVKPDNWTDLLARRKTRDIIAGSVVTFPRLLNSGNSALPAPSPE